ncbi:SusC/RagA family TonB-linked outer membrane protein [Spongiimicrobium sp. 3-5]|uniref:SusC/RagA family TonB-linked outer membrane protein n=1 Tax=Spongiimicrobium sp. 3-5 TaxID=3332596 RepID=UPI00397EC337
MGTNYFRIFWILPLVLVGLQSNAQTVTGRVTDASGPLPGASIVVDGTTNGTQTDFDGNYSLDNVGDQATLIFSYIGYSSQEIRVNGQTSINVLLQEDAQALAEVVVLGYGQIQNKRTVTTAVGVVKAEQIKQLPISQAEAALQGTVPGVVVQQNSGSPGSPQTVRVRGIGTPNNANPLFIVDGVQVPNLTFLNPSDIVTQTVLKDAASTSIYGSRGGNGVILVETLKGTRNSSKPEISVQSFYGIQTLANKPELMNRDQYVQYYNQGVAAAGGSIVAGFRGAFTEAERAALPDTDWYDVLFDDAPIQNVYASIVGGGDKITYAVSGGYFGQEGILGGNNKAEFNRRNIRTALTIDLSNKLSVTGVAQYQNQDRYTISQNNGAAGSGISSFINALPPIYPAFDEAGNFFNPFLQNGVPTANGVPLNSLGAVQNPLFSIAASDTQAVQDILNLSIVVNWEPVDNLKLSGTYGSFNNFSFIKNFSPLIQQPDQEYDTSTGVAYQESSNRQINRQYGGTAQFFFNKLAEKNHNLNILLGYEVVETGFFGGATTRDAGQFLTNDFKEVNFALSVDNTDATVVPGTSTEIAMESFFGKVDYNYKEKYLLSAVLRKDKSSNFGADNREAWFPAVSAGWILSEENFLQNVNTLNLLKIRGSWGVSGNDRSARALAFLSSVSTNASYAGQPGIVLTGLANPDLGWEELTQFNIGLDINAFNNKLGLTVDYYTKETTDILLSATTPLTSGLTPAVQNIGALDNSGLEVLVSYRDNYESGFGWNVAANVGFNKNEVTDLGETSFISSAQIQPQFNDFASRTQVGDPIASFYGYVVEGVDANGNLLFEDINGNGNNQLVPDGEDKAIIGDPNPDATFGFSIGVNYKGFDFSTFMSGTAGNDILDATIRYDAQGTSRPSSYVTEPGAPRNVVVSSSPNNGEQLISDFHIKDGTYLKVKNVTLGYSFPESALNALGAKEVRIYVSGQNLFTFTEYTGIDPEIGQNNISTPLNIGIDQGFFPQARQVLLGFNFKF